MIETGVKRPGRAAGFSLAELIVSIGIVGCSIVLVMGIFAVLLGGGQKSSDLTNGSIVADGLMSQNLYQLFASTTAANAFFEASYSTPTLYRGGTYSLNNTTFFYKLYCTDVQLNTVLHDANTDGTLGQTYLKRFDMVVWWNDSAAANQTNLNNLIINQSARQQGVQQIHKTRLVWANGTY